MGSQYAASRRVAPEVCSTCVTLCFTFKMWGEGDACDTTQIKVDELFNIRSVLRVIDVLGRENSLNSFVIEIFNDGTVEKKKILKPELLNYF